MLSMEAGPESLELKVLALIEGGFKSREMWEAECPHLAPLDEGHRMILNLAAAVERQGLVLGSLATSPQTRAELRAEMPGMVNRAPAWMDAHLQGREAMTLDLFCQGLAQTLATHRTAIERLIDEQMVDPGSIKETLAEAPVPAGAAREDEDALLEGVTQAMMAHLKAIVALARDLEDHIGRRLMGED